MVRPDGNRQANTSILNSSLSGHHAQRTTLEPPLPGPGRLGVLLLILLSMSATGSAAVLQVPRGYTTITKALTLAQDGDTIRVAAGTYSPTTGEQFPLRVNKAITLEGDTANRPHLQGDKKHTAILIESGGVTVQGFHITDANGSEGINSMDGGGICVFVGPSETRDVSIIDCLIERNVCPTNETYDGCGGGIYCGGTYCECFSVNISNCLIQNNTIRGSGGGVFCALLSNVNMTDVEVTANRADDHGGGVFVDVFGVLAMTNVTLELNNCPGDPLKADWGGKGGGLACQSYGVFTAERCHLTTNTARYYGGGIFTRAGYLPGAGACVARPSSSSVSNCTIEKNLAKVFGGGVYVASNASLSFSASTLYWNDANHPGGDGGGVYVAGGDMGGGTVTFDANCLLEGNESANNGGGVYLGVNAQGTFEGAKLIGNSSLWDGGALFLDRAVVRMNDCLITYNNSARGLGGALRATQQSQADLVHCSVVGSFAPRKRSGLYVDGGARVNIKDSILWHNAGGSAEASSATITIATSLCEDGATPATGVIGGDPRYAAWGTQQDIYATPGSDLQKTLNQFDLHLATDSPCLARASDGGDMGADTGIGGTAGNIIAALHVSGSSPLPIRGRNLMFVRSVQGAGATTISHAVFAGVPDTSVTGVVITAEKTFGGVTARTDVNFVDCQVRQNTSLDTGGGVYLAEGHCEMTRTHVSTNTSGTNGGGIYLRPQTTLDFTLSYLEGNAAANGGGAFASDATTTTIIRSDIVGNSAGANGGGLYLDTDSVSSLSFSRVLTNSAGTLGGGIYVNGQLTVADVNVIGNKSSYVAGGIEVDTAGDMTVNRSYFSTNNANSHGGAINTQGELEVYDSQFESNTASLGGAIHFWQETGNPGLIVRSSFRKNSASDQGGAVRLHAHVSPVFTGCTFTENTANLGGAGLVHNSGIGSRPTQPTFEDCTFRSDTAKSDGGSVYLWSSSARFMDCNFTNETAKNQEGGTAYFRGTDNSSFERCSIDKSTAGTSGGALYLMDSVQPTFSKVRIANCRAADNGGAIALVETSIGSFSEVTVSDCTAAVRFGGGIHATDNSQSLFETCSFAENQTTGVSADGGGAFFRGNAKGWFVRCAFRSNTANDDGGGLAADEQAVLDVRNTLFTGNTASHNTGGGVFFTGHSTGTLQNCTIVENVAYGFSGTGGGIYTESAAPGVVKVDSSIICRNTPEGIPSAANITVTYSAVQGTSVWPGTGNILCDACTLDPNFVPLSGSSCIDAGDPSASKNDAYLPPGQQTPRNDMGWTGGPDNSPGPVSSDPNLVGWWTFDEVIGIWTLDNSGHGRHATLVNGPTFVAGQIGKAVHFDGANDYVRASANSLPTAERTAALWFNAETLNTRPTVLGYGGGTCGTSWLMGLNHSGQGGVSVTAHCSVDTLTYKYSKTPTGAWYHLAISTDAAGTNIYLNGTSVATNQIFVGNTVAAGMDLAIGVAVSPQGKAPYTDNNMKYFCGTIDDVRIYDRALSPEEIAALCQ